MPGGADDWGCRRWVFFSPVFTGHWSFPNCCLPETSRNILMKKQQLVAQSESLSQNRAYNVREAPVLAMCSCNLHFDLRFCLFVGTPWGLRTQMKCVDQLQEGHQRAAMRPAFEGFGNSFTRKYLEGLIVPGRNGKFLLRVVAPKSISPLDTMFN